MHTQLNTDTLPGSGRSLRLTAIGIAIALAAASWLLGRIVGYRGQAGAGALCFIAIVAACSPDLRRVNWRTVLWGVGLQLGFALFILRLQIGGTRPGYEFFAAVARGVSRFLEFTSAGSTFVFGALANQTKMTEIFGSDNGFVFAFTALPTIIFISSFFTVLC
jgi:concentrative nucleoside transporter, CNT family